MPITEGLLCGKPVIAPNSTAPGEYLTDETAYLVPVMEHEAADISDPFGGAFRRGYGQPGVTFLEPNVTALREAMRAVVSERGEAMRRGRAGRAMVREMYDWRSAALGVEEALMRAVG